jgi:hypothetical protein
MKALPVVALLAVACGGDHPNPSQLWIAPNGSETVLQLVPVKPHEF